MADKTSALAVRAQPPDMPSADDMDAGGPRATRAPEFFVRDATASGRLPAVAEPVPDVMRALVKESPRAGVRIREVPVPRPAERLLSTPRPSGRCGHSCRRCLPRSRGVRVHGITGRRLFESWYQARAFLEEGLDLAPIITHRLPLSRHAEAFELVETRRAGKVMLLPQEG